MVEGESELKLRAKPFVLIVPFFLFILRIDFTFSVFPTNITVTPEIDDEYSKVSWWLSFIPCF